MQYLAGTGLQCIGLFEIAELNDWRINRNTIRKLHIKLSNRFASSCTDVVHCDRHIVRYIKECRVTPLDTGSKVSVCSTCTYALTFLPVRRPLPVPAFVH